MDNRIDLQVMEQQRYPHLSTERINDFESINASPEQIAKADQAAKKEIDERLRKYNLNEEFTEGGSECPRINVAVIGKVGSGKSATANTLLREKKYTESTSAVTKNTEAGPFTSTHYPILTVADTSGSWHLSKITAGAAHIALYVLVINLASPRFRKEDIDEIRSLKDYNNIIKSRRCIVLLTHASDSLQGKSLYEYVQEIRGDPLYDLIMEDMEGSRVMAINNNCDTKYEADKQHEMIVNILHKTYQVANFNKNTFLHSVENKVLYAILVVLCILILALVIFLTVWYTSIVPESMMLRMPVTREPNGTNESTTLVAATDTT